MFEQRLKEAAHVEMAGAGCSEAGDPPSSTCRVPEAGADPIGLYGPQEVDFFLVCFYYIFNQRSDIGKCMFYKMLALELV